MNDKFKIAFNRPSSPGNFAFGFPRPISGIKDVSVVKVGQTRNSRIFSNNGGWTQPPSKNNSFMKSSNKTSLLE